MSVMKCLVGMVAAIAGAIGIFAWGVFDIVDVINVFNETQTIEAQTLVWGVVKIVFCSVGALPGYLISAVWGIFD